MDGHQGIEPLTEIRSLIVINQQLISNFEKAQREQGIDIELALRRVGTIETSLAVIANRLDRIEKDFSEAKQQNTQRNLVVWAALLSAVLAVVVPLVVRPGTNNIPSSYRDR